MKAGIIIKNGDIKCIDIVEPNVNEKSVKIKVCYTGICGSDIPRAWKNGAHNYPIVLGHEFSGVVHEVGENVKDLKIGDKVVGIPLVPCFVCDDCNNGNYALCKNYSFIGSRQQGSMAEYIVLPEKNVFKIPQTISLKEAAFFEPSTVALHGINLCNYKPNKTVAILGGGNIGIFVLQWAKILGAKKIVVIGRNVERSSLLIKAGADHFISVLDEDYMKKLSDISSSLGFDYIFETAGSIEMMKLAYKIAASKGNICMIGTPNKELSFSPKEWELLNRKELNICGSWMSYSSPWPGVEWELTSKMLNSGQLKIFEEMIYNTYDLDKIEDAFELYNNDGTVAGKVLIRSNSL